MQYEETIYEHEIFFVNGTNWNYSDEVEMDNEEEIFRTDVQSNKRKNIIYCKPEIWKKIEELERETYFCILELYIKEEKTYAIETYINKRPLLNYLHKNKEQNEIIKRAKCIQYLKGASIEIPNIEKADAEKYLVLQMKLTGKEIEKINKIPWTSFEVGGEIGYLSFDFPHEICISNKNEKIDREVLLILEAYKEKIKSIIDGYIEKESFYQIIEYER